MDYRKPRFLGGGATAAALAVVAALGLLESRSRREVLQSAGWVTHTLRVQRDLGLARALLTDAETGQRGFLLTLDESYLDPNDAAQAALPGVLARLRALTADNPAQQQRFAQLERLVGQRLDVIRQTLVLAMRGERERAVQIVVEGRGRALMSEIRGVLQSGMNDEERLLQEREARLGRSIARRGLETQILIAGLAAGLIVGAVLLVRLNRAHAQLIDRGWAETEIK